MVKHKTTGTGTKVTDTVWSEDHDLSTITETMIPDTTNVYDLGDSTHRFGDLYVDKIAQLYGGDISTVGSIFTFQRAGTDKIVMDALNQTTDFNLRPDLTSKGRLGYSSKVWNELWVNTLNAVYGVVTLKTFFCDTVGVAYNPGDTVYHDIGETTSYVALDYIKPKYARVVACINADEAGNTYIKIKDTGGDVAEAYTAAIGLTSFAGAWTAFTDTADIGMTVSYKASSNTETLTVHNVGLELR